MLDPTGRISYDRVASMADGTWYQVSGPTLLPGADWLATIFYDSEQDAWACMPYGRVTHTRPGAEAIAQTVRFASARELTNYINGWFAPRMAVRPLGLRGLIEAARK